MTFTFDLASNIKNLEIIIIIVVIFIARILSTKVSTPRFTNLVKLTNIHISLKK